MSWRDRESQILRNRAIRKLLVFAILVILVCWIVFFAHVHWAVTPTR